MRALPVNLVNPRPWRTWAGALVFVAATAVAAAQGWRAWQAYMATRNLQRQSQQQAPHTDQSATAPVAIDSTTIEPAYAADAAAVAKLASFDVAGVLANIEAAKVLGVRVVSIEIAAAEATTRIEIESPDHQAAVQYTAALNKADKSHRWDLSRAQLHQTSGVTATIVGTEPRTNR